jgi:hypothetical protein
LITVSLDMSSYSQWYPTHLHNILDPRKSLLASQKHDTKDSSNGGGCCMLTCIYEGGKSDNVQIKSELNYAASIPGSLGTEGTHLLKSIFPLVSKQQESSTALAVANFSTVDLLTPTPFRPQRKTNREVMWQKPCASYFMQMYEQPQIYILMEQTKVNV